MEPHQLELLAPARDADIGIEAVNHGADAVYIGGPSFGARASAANEIADIARLVAHAHRFNARVFVTLNTILRDDELEPARQQVWQLYDAGVDALIIQDMGLLELDLPPIQLHASTQTDIRTPEKARFLQDVGLSQIVLARELDLEQIAAIRAATRPETTLEFFVHGALCVAYSGQCYISHAHTGRSANRGDCSQACRLPYQVTDMEGRIVAHDKHVLSMKDNNQSDNLEALIDAGIRSFKIEGRYKDMGYVKNITAHYRTLLDEIIERRPEFARASSRPHHLRLHPRPRPELQPRIHRLLRQRPQGRHRRVRHAEEPRPADRLRQQGRRQMGRAARRLARHRAEQRRRPLLLHAAEGTGRPRDQPCRKSGRGRVARVPEGPDASFKDLRAGTLVNRNRDMNWMRMLDKASSERRIGVWLRLDETDDGLCTDADRRGRPQRHGGSGARQGAGQGCRQGRRHPARASRQARHHASCEPWALRWN